MMIIMFFIVLSYKIQQLFEMSDNQTTLYLVVWKYDKRLVLLLQMVIYRICYLSINLSIAS